MNTQISIQSIILSCTLLLVACSTIPETKLEQEKYKRLSFEVKEEMVLGRQMAAKLLGHFGFYRGNGPELQYLNLVGQAMARSFGRPEIPFRFGILATDEVNAFATPGGYIFVTKGLLSAVKTESELAAVLAHEIAHVNLKHMYSKLVPKKEATVESTMVRLMARGRSELGQSITQMVNQGMRILLKDGLGKEKEREADEAAVMYLASAGYNPTGLHSFLKFVHKNRNRLKISPAAPNFPDRIFAAELFLAKNGLIGPMVAKSSVLENRFKRAFSSFVKAGRNSR